LEKVFILKKKIVYSIILVKYLACIGTYERLKKMKNNYKYQKRVKNN